MKERCYQQRSVSFCRYGAVGINMCKEWFDSYYSFAEWAKNSEYDGVLTIDRINNKLGYSPQNCKWSTPKEQANNRRSNHYLEINGEVNTIAQWSEKTGIKQTTIQARLKKWGDIERVLLTPTMTSYRNGRSIV